MSESSREPSQFVVDETEAAKQRAEIERLREEKVRKEQERQAAQLARDAEVVRKRILTEYAQQQPTVQQESEQQAARAKRNRVLLLTGLLGLLAALLTWGWLSWQQMRRVDTLQEKQKARLEQAQRERTQRQQNRALQRANLQGTVERSKRKVEELQGIYQALPDPAAKKAR